MEKSMSEKEQDILRNVVKEEIDFISCVDINSGSAHVIVTDRDADVMPPDGEDYDEVNRRTIRDFVHPEDQEECARQLEISHILKELAGRERVIVPYRLLCGEEYRCKELAISYDRGDKNTLVFVRRDVTDSYEEMCRHKEELYQALLEERRAKEEKLEFLEHMGQGIRAPMNSIIGLSYLTDEHADNQKQVRENLSKIHASSQFLLTFLDDVMNLTQIESGRVTCAPEPEEWDVFFGELCEAAALKSEQKNITFLPEIRGEFGGRYLFDAAKLYRAMINILDNAIRFTPPEGKVEFIAEKINDTADEAVIWLEVRDNGIGIGEEFLPHVFEPFAQEDSGNTTLYGGMGLGLAISKALIELLGGRIDVYSKKGRGTTMVVALTLQKTEEMKRCPCREDVWQEHAEYDFTGKRALLVEDNEINIEITRNLLQHRNLEVEVARNGKEGVECYVRHEPGYYDIILMDIRMPVMDGLEATRKIRYADRADSETVPIVAMTANVFEEDVHRAMEAGMDEYLTKPLDVWKMYGIIADKICK